MIFRRKSREPATEPEAEQPSITFDPFRGDPVARMLSEALGEHDWPRAKSIITTAGPDQFDWLVDIAATKRNILEWINDAVRADPDSVLPTLIKGVATMGWAWEARGGGWARDVPQDAWQTVNERLRLAEDCLDEVIARDPRCQPALNHLIGLATSRSKSMDEKRRRFEAATNLDPLNVTAHSRMLVALARKWGGSSEQMFAFARSSAALAPDGHDLHELIADAHIEEWLINNHDDAYFEQQEVGDEVVAAAHRTIWHPAYQRSHRTAHTLNTFAFVLSAADRFGEAERCFVEIGDGLVTRHPWSYREGEPAKSFIDYRAYVRESIAFRAGAPDAGH